MSNTPVSAVLMYTSQDKSYVLRVVRTTAKFTFLARQVWDYTKQEYVLLPEFRKQGLAFESVDVEESVEGGAAGGVSERRGWRRAIR